ncbi:MAG: DUF559 domain-containing protein [Acidimicrobiales bacterium]|nr:DUF559 domain-containing protein [Acidimicrobiales bacterium]
MLRQMNVGDAESWLGRVDFFDPDAKLVVQIDGNRFHQALLDRRCGTAQTAALVAAGFSVLRITESELWYRPAHVIRRVRNARRSPQLVGPR